VSDAYWYGTSRRLQNIYKDGDWSETGNWMVGRGNWIQDAKPDEVKKLCGQSPVKIKSVFLKINNFLNNFW
jgi:hypothetical protein